MNTWDGWDFILTTTVVGTLVSGCARDLVVDEGDTMGSGGHTALAANVTTGGWDPEECGSLPQDGTRWPGSSEACPASQPTKESCDGSVEELCVYQDIYGMHFECACIYDRTTQGLAYQCRESRFSRSSSCPELPPRDAASCFGARGELCHYGPAGHCECPDTENPVWSCEAKTELLATAPEDINLDTLVSELTEAERLAVCEWVDAQYSGAFGTPSAPASKVGPDGFTVDNGCKFDRVFDESLTFPRVSREQCAANLALSTCSAPLSEYAECISGRSCGRYAEHADCYGTTVFIDTFCEGQPSGSCRLRVE